jgi:hypothetical protein
LTITLGQLAEKHELEALLPEGGEPFFPILTILKVIISAAPMVLLLKALHPCWDILKRAQLNKRVCTMAQQQFAGLPTHADLVAAFKRGKDLLVERIKKNRDDTLQLEAEKLQCDRELKQRLEQLENMVSEGSEKQKRDQAALQAELKDAHKKLNKTNNKPTKANQRLTQEIKASRQRHEELEKQMQTLAEASAKHAEQLSQFEAFKSACSEAITLAQNEPLQPTLIALRKDIAKLQKDVKTIQEPVRPKPDPLAATKPVSTQSQKQRAEQDTATGRNGKKREEAPAPDRACTTQFAIQLKELSDRVNLCETYRSKVDEIYRIFGKVNSSPLDMEQELRGLATIKQCLLDRTGETGMAKAFDALKAEWREMQQAQAKLSSSNNNMNQQVQDLRATQKHTIKRVENVERRLDTQAGYLGGTNQRVGNLQATMTREQSRIRLDLEQMGGRSSNLWYVLPGPGTGGIDFYTWCFNLDHAATELKSRIEALENPAWYSQPSTNSQFGAQTYQLQDRSSTGSGANTNARRTRSWSPPRSYTPSGSGSTSSRHG